MTVIATDGRSIVADGRSTSSNYRIVNDATKKLVRLKDGSILGVAGEAESQARLVLHFNEAGPWPGGNYDALRLLPDGSALYYSEKSEGHGLPCTTPAVLGCGGGIALGAMLKGATPREAVELACSVDVFSGGTLLELAPGAVESG